MELKIKTITPTHIGNGEELYALDYVTDGKYYYRVSQKQFLEFLRLANNKDLINAYSKWIVDTEEEMEKLRSKIRGEKEEHWEEDYNQKLSSIKNKFNLLEFVKIHGKENAFISFLRENEAVSKIPFTGKVRGQVRSHVKDGRRRPYLPGSSIKGAIRSALLYSYLSKHANKQKVLEVLTEEVEKIKNTRNKKQLERAKKSFANRLEEMAFYCKTVTVKEEKEVTKHDDEQMDIMKFLSISDASFKHEQDLLDICDVNAYLVQKKYDKRKKESYFESVIQRQPPFLEVLKSKQVLSSTIKFDIDFFVGIKEKLGSNENGLKQGNKTVWLGLTEKIKQVFNLDLTTVSKGNKKEIEDQVLNYIMNCVKQFSARQEIADEEWLERIIYYDTRWKTNSNKIKAGREVLYKYNKKSDYLSRIGYATGFNGVTEILYILDDPDLKLVFKEAMEIFLIGDNPKAEKQRVRESEKYHKTKDVYEPNLDTFPKSRRMIHGKEAIVPLGWVKFELGLGIKYFKGIPNPKKPPVLDAEVVKSGRPNRVKVYFKEDDCPVLILNGYRNSLPVGTLVKVKTTINNRKKITQVSFDKEIK